MTAADIIAAALTQHTTVSFPDRVAAAVLDALQAAGYEVVLLPEPRVVPSPNRALFEGCGKVTVERNAGMVLELNSGMAFRPDDARSFAAALLAAANAAEEAK